MVAVALVSLAGVAVAATRLFIQTYTHVYPPKWAIGGAGPGEILNTRGTSFERIAIALAADIDQRDLRVGDRLAPGSAHRRSCPRVA